MNKLIMGIAALVVIAAPARAEISDAVLAEMARQAAAFRANDDKYGPRKAPPIKVYVYTVPAKAAPAAPVVQPKPQPAPRYQPAPRTQAVKLEER